MQNIADVLAELFHLSQNAREPFFGVVKLRVDPDHADQVEYLGQHRWNVLGVRVGKLVAQVFENRQELEVALRLVRAILQQIGTYQLTTHAPH